MQVRLFGRFHKAMPKKVTHIRLRVAARNIPAGASVDIADLQLQPGRMITGFDRHDADMGVRAVDGYQWRSGVVYGDSTLIVIADEVAASPTRWEITRANGDIQIGDFHFGHVSPVAVVDGHAGTATQGAGLPPHLTARADIDVPLKMVGRAFMSCWFRGLAQVVPEMPPPDPDPVDPDEPWPVSPEPEVEEPPEPEPVDPDAPDDEEPEGP